MPVALVVTLPRVQFPQNAGHSTGPAGKRCVLSGICFDRRGGVWVSYKRMKQDGETTQSILSAARELFAERGYDGASIRAITARAGVNLGAVTYHFGTKERLYLAVVATATRPLLDRVTAAGADSIDPLDRIESVLRCAFGHFAEFREAGSFMLQELSLHRSLPLPMRTVMESNIRLVAELIRQGQEFGSIAAGDPTLLALSVVSQPIYYTLAQDPLRDAIGLDRSDPETQSGVVEHVVAFVRRGLSADRRNP